MKRLFTQLTTLIIALITFVSCSENLLETDESWSNVYPGVDIYNRVVTTNRLATDGVTVALKLGTLLEQAEVEGLTITNSNVIDWSQMSGFTLPFNGLDYNLKLLLFGEDSKCTIVKSGDKYRVNYGVDSLFTSGVILDNFYRIGGYEIDTKGVKLSESSIDTTWDITIAADRGVKFADSEKSYATTEIQTLNSSIWYNRNGGFSYSSTECQAAYLIDDAPISNWSTSGSFRFSDYQNLEIDNIVDSKLYHTIDATSQGITLTGKNITYSTGGITTSIRPITYHPFHTLLLIEEGTEEAYLNGDYDQEDYPSPCVIVSWYDDVPTIIYDESTFQY